MYLAGMYMYESDILVFCAISKCLFRRNFYVYCARLPHIYLLKFVVLFCAISTCVLKNEMFSNLLFHRMHVCLKMSFLVFCAISTCVLENKVFSILFDHHVYVGLKTSFLVFWHEHCRRINAELCAWPLLTLINDKYSTLRILGINMEEERIQYSGQTRHEH